MAKKQGVLECADDGTFTELHPHADMVLTLRRDSTAPIRRYLAHSEVLVGASPYFKSLLGGRFREGHALRSEQRPEIVLEEDDPEAMDVLLAALHHKTTSCHKHVDLQLLAQIARASDKYRCNGALSPWVYRWLRDSRDPKNTLEHGLILMATYLFEAVDEWPAISARAVRHLPLGFAASWSDHESLSALPDSIKDALESQRRLLLTRLHEEVQSSVGILQSNPRAFAKNQLFCRLCSRVHPGGSKQCHPCKNKDLLDVLCTSQTRVAEYLEFLRDNELWPSVNPFLSCAVTEITSRLAGLSVERRHRCEGGPVCPLKVELNRLRDSTGRILESADGVIL